MKLKERQLLLNIQIKNILTKKKIKMILSAILIFLQTYFI